MGNLCRGAAPREPEESKPGTAAASASSSSSSAKKGRCSKDPEDVLGSPNLGKTRPSSEHLATEEVLPEAELLELVQLLFGREPEVQDVERWMQVGFQLSEAPGTEWGLCQRKGGPCGVFAPVQAFIVKSLLFGNVRQGEVDEGLAALIQEQPLALAGEGEAASRHSVLAHALATMVNRATPTSSYVLCEVSASDPQAAAEAVRGGNIGVEIKVSLCRRKRISDVLAFLEDGAETWLAGPCGVISFVSSVLLSRTLAGVREDMDDSSTPLITRFGHCNQELANLMLVGVAASNVFDGTRWLGDDPSSGFRLRGIESDGLGTPPVGFLSELEPLRYLTVGNTYKHPEFPLWVLGSASHFTLLFSSERSVCELSEKVQIEQKARQAFNDNAIDEEGIAMASNLEKMLNSLGIGMEGLADATAEIVNEDVILWADFRRWVLMQFGMPDDPFAMQSDSGIRFFVYDGQDPPGPSLRAVSVHTGAAANRLPDDGDAFAAMLRTRWPNCSVDAGYIELAIDN